MPLLHVFFIVPIKAQATSLPQKPCSVSLKENLTARFLLSLREELFYPLSRRGSISHGEDVESHVGDMGVFKEKLGKKGPDF